MSNAKATRRRAPVRALRTGFLAIVLAAGVPSAAAAQVPVDADLERLEARLAEATDAAWHLLVPGAFDEARKLWEDARRRRARGEDPASLRPRVDRAVAAFETLETRARAAEPIFHDALLARARALREGADARDPDGWAAADEELRRAGQRLGRDDGEGAAERAARAALLYDRAAGSARRDRLLGAAEAARETAIAAGASALSPESFTAGEAAMSAARAALESGVSDSEIAAHADRARGAFERATGIAVLADSVLRREVPVERLVAAREADLDRVARAAGVPPEARASDPASLVELIERTLRAAKADSARLAAELAGALAEADRLGDRVSRLEAQLAEGEARYTEARDRLLAFQERDARLRETRALFGPGEGDVLIDGDRLVLRLHGLTFPSGSAELDPALEPLLTKIQRVLMEFPDAPVRIEGHTDARGSDEGNRALSQRRAIAVREHLLARLPISSSRIEAVGVGEDRPIASNDTDEGRARNRRIEIILSLGPEARPR